MNWLRLLRDARVLPLLTPFKEGQNTRAYNWGTIPVRSNLLNSVVAYRP